ncbi:MAG: SDR family oxidoreductase [Pseudomonadales bacterium]
MELENKVVLVTGATQGLGRALTIEFAAAGCRVVGIGRNLAKLEEIRAQIEGEFTPIECDVSDHEAVCQAVQQTLSLYGGVDVLFNNAAVYPKVSFLEETPEAWTSAMGANVNGVAYFCKAVLPVMIRAGQGRVYNLGSWAYLGPIPKSAAYSASKGAVHTLTGAIAQDLAQFNTDVQVHEWIPGHLKTQMSDHGGIDPHVSAKWAVAMVRNDAASKASVIFENDYEWIPPKRIKDRILDLLLFR